MKSLCRVVFALSALASLPHAIESADLESQPKLTSLEGYPGVLSREYVQVAVEQELRYKFYNMYSQGQNVTAKPQKQPRQLNSGDLTGLNDYLGQIEFDVPDQNFETELLGTVASVTATGKCGNFNIDSLDLTYETGGDSLTYYINAQNIDLKCQFQVFWNLGELDVEDKLQIRLVSNNNDIMIGITLTGSPPTSSTFEGCNVVINVNSIDSSGGFSADILNELEDLILEVVHNEAQAISDILCDLIGGFSGTVDELLLDLEQTLAPYLVKVANVDPLRLENDVQVEETLVNLLDSTLGEVLQVFITNLRGVIGAFQINKLLELNLLDENGLFIIDLNEEEGGGRRLQDEGAETCSFLRRRRHLKDTAANQDSDRRIGHDFVRNLEDTLRKEISNPLERHVKQSVERHLQEEEAPPIFEVNEIALQNVALDGLNSFQDSQLLEIIGKQTLRSKFAIEGISVVVTLILDVRVGNTNIRETITATTSVNGISATASFFVGLNEEVVNGLSLGNFLDTDNIFDCLLSTIVAAGVSELSVSVKDIATPVVSGAIAPGIDDFLNKAVEAALVTYEDLLFLALPNIFQNNVTVLVNDYLDCYVRVEASRGSCPETTLQEAVGLGGEDGTEDSTGTGDSASGAEGDITFSFRDENAGSTTQFNGANVDDSSTSNNPEQSSAGTFQAPVTSPAATSSTGNSTQKSGSFITTDASFIQNAAASATAEGFVDGFIDFRDLLLPPDAARSLGGSGTQPYGNLISMGFEMMKDQMVSLDNITGLPTINTEVIQPLTEGQSGVNGMLRIPEIFFNTSVDTMAVQFLQSLLKQIDISAFDARIGNLNTLVSPLRFLEPTKHPHVLENILNFGPISDRPLNLTVALGTNLEGAGSSLGWINEIDISAAAAELDVITDIQLMISAKDFLKFPIKDILNFNCWLALITASNMDFDDVDTISNALAVKSFLMKVVSTTLDFKCRNCMSKLLPGALTILEQVGATKTLGSRIAGLLEEVVTIDTVPALLTDFLKLGEEAARLCPHSPTFNTTSDLNNTLSLSIPPLSNQAIDTIMFAGVLGAQVMAVSFAESHLSDEVVQADALSGQALKSFPDGVELLDWTRLNETFIPFAGDMLEFTRDYLSGTVNETDELSVNDLFGDFLDDDGGMSFDLDGVTFEFGGVEIAVHTAHVKGLDSFKRFDVLHPIAPQTLQNTVELKHLSLNVDFSLNVTATSEPPRPYAVSFDLEDVNATVYLYTAIDMVKARSLEVGSLLYLENLVPCFLSTAYNVHIPATQITVGSITKPEVTGFLADSSEAVSASMSAMFQAYGNEMTDAMNSIIDSTMRGFVNDFIASYIKDSAGCKNTFASPLDSSTTLKFSDGATLLKPSKAFDDFLDFRDLLLPTESAIKLGGTGSQPYGDLIPMAFAMIKDQFVSASEGELLETNEMLIDPFTDSQSGKKGMLRFKQEIFAFAVEKVPVSILDWLEQRLEVRAFDVRLRNINTLVSPISLFQPTHSAHVLENMINFGPQPESPLNGTIGFQMAIDGDLSSLDMHNEFDVSASVSQVNVFTDVSLMLAKELLFRFPLKDITNLNCWLSMIQQPDSDNDASSHGFEMKSFLMKLASLSVDLQCRNCTSTMLPRLIEIMEQTRISETFGNRLGPLLEEVFTSDMVPTILKHFINIGDEAARFCPHSSLFNTTEIETTAKVQNMQFPALSSTSLDTVLFSALLAAQIAIVVITDSHAEDNSEEMNTVVEQGTTSTIPSDSRLLDWTDLNSTTIPFIGGALHFVQNSLGEITVTDTGSQELGINVLVRDLMGAVGELKIPLGFTVIEGLSIQSMRLQGLDSFTRFDVLKPLTEQSVENFLTVNNLTIGLDFSLDVLETPEAPMEASISLNIDNLNITMPFLAAIDEERLSALKLGTFLNSSNILPCLLATTYGLRVQKMLVSVGNIAEPVIEGLMPDTNKALADSFQAVWSDFHGTIKAGIPNIFDDTLRTLINGVLANQEKKECQEQYTTPSSRYVDFREMFQPSNVSISPYGDLMPILKTMLESELLSNSPGTQVPKINDVLIAPLTEAQSGTRGTLALPGEVFGFDFDGLAELGIDNLGVGLSDARIENLDSVGPPLQILEPNFTSGVLLDNRATFGTEDSPIRFAIKSRLALSGPLLNTRDEMDIFGELRGAPFFAVLLARVGSQELLSFPLKYATALDCWLATIAAPALEEIAQGKTEMDPVLALEYLGIAFSSVRVSASCFNCTTPGFIRLPELLAIMESSGTKDVLGHRAIDIVMDTLTSDFSQVWILKILQDSMRKCPLTANYTDNSIVIADADLPTISADWIETGIFAATVFAQLGTVVLAETVSVVDSEIGPMFEEPEPDIPPGTRLVDFTALDTYPLGSLARRLIEGANSFLGVASTDPETGETKLGINELLGGNPIRDLGTFSQKFDDFVFDVSGLQFKLKEVKISGLDSFTKFQIMDITGPTQLQNELGWKSLHLEIFVEIDPAASPSLQQSPDANEKLSFSVEFEAADIESSLELMLALDYELLKNLQLGSLLRFAHILPCIQATVRHLEISKMKLDIGRITKMRLNGLKSSDTSRAAEELERLVLEKYNDVLANAAPSLFSVALRPLINTAITSYIRDSDFKCDEFPFDSQGSGFIDFRDMFLSPTQSKRLGGSGRGQYGDLIRSAFGIMRLQLMTAHPEDGIELLTPLIGSLSFPGVLLNQGIKFNLRELQADVSLRVSDLRVNNLDSLGKPLSFLEPVHDEAHQLNNSASLGIGNRPVEVGGRVYMHVKGIGGLDILNDFDLTLDIHAATAVLTLLLKVSEQAFVRFPLRDVLNLNCWLAMIPPPKLDGQGVRIEGAQPTAALTNFDMSAKQLNLRLDCHNCSSNALSEFANSLAAPESPEEMTEVVNRVLHSITSNLKGGFIQDQINRLLVEAPKHCGHTDDYDPNATPAIYDVFETRSASSSSSYVTMLVVILIPIFLVAVIALIIRQVVHQRHKKWLVALPSEQIFLIQQKQEREEQKEAELNELTQSMYRSQDIPLFVRQLIPVVVVANIGFFLSGHLNKGGRVLIDLVFAGESFQIDNFYTFSIGQSAVDMWHNGGKELAVLILLFSGVWPYTKQLITLALWFLPPSAVSCSRRGQFLLWLDILAKWSMIDIIVMLITVVGFRVKIRNPDFAFVPDNFYSVDLLVVPMFGLYANLIAQLTSQISSHFIVHYHRRIIRRATVIYEQRYGLQNESHLSTEDAVSGGLLPSAGQEEAKKDRLCNQAFSRPHREETDTLIVRRYINKLLLTGSLLLCVLLITSGVIPSLKLETFGVVGLLIEFGQNLKDAVRYEGVFSMANVLTEQAKYLGGFTHHIGMGFLAFIFVMTVMVVPVMQILTLLFQWFFPLAPKGRAKVATVLELLQAWQYVEVFILAMLVESWQLGSISKLLLNHFCSGLDFTFNLLVYYGVLEENDGQCFAIEASISVGGYLMVLIVVGLALVNTFVVKAYTQYLREKREAEEGVSEDEKLRAFDRSHWDSREEALELIEAPEAQFTDTFRWVLCREDGGIGKLNQTAEEESKVMFSAGTDPLADTSSSDEEHGRRLPSVTEADSSTSNGSSLNVSGDDAGIMVSTSVEHHSSAEAPQASSDWSSESPGSHDQEIEEDEGSFTT